MASSNVQMSHALLSQMRKLGRSTNQKVRKSVLKMSSSRKMANMSKLAFGKSHLKGRSKGKVTAKQKAARRRNIKVAQRSRRKR